MDQLLVRFDISKSVHRDKTFDPIQRGPSYALRLQIVNMINIPLKLDDRILCRGLFRENHRMEVTWPECSKFSFVGCFLARSVTQDNPTQDVVVFILYARLFESSTSDHLP